MEEQNEIMWNIPSFIPLLLKKGNMPLREWVFLGCYVVAEQMRSGDNTSLGVTTWCSALSSKRREDTRSVTRVHR